MADRTVTVIQPRLHLPSLSQESRKQRVAAYARVSTDSDAQMGSVEAQKDYFEKLILKRPDWEFAGIYADEGISGTSLNRRDAFNRMVADALDGKIDLIVTKSVRRFARNTIDSLTTVRKLKDAGVEEYFEKENIWTLDSKGELLITIMSSLAQEESRSISENVTWVSESASPMARSAFPMVISWDIARVRTDCRKLYRRKQKLYGAFTECIWKENPATPSQPT